MKLNTVVLSLVTNNKISNREVENAILDLVETIDDVRILRRITKKLNAIMEYEDEKIS